jgi:hypothetical protein
MDVGKLWRLLYRRKLVVGPMIVLALVSLVAAYKKSPPTYKATGSIVLLSPPPPPDGTKIDASSGTNNPYERFGDLSVVVDVLVRLVNSAPAATRLQQQGVGGTYTIGANITYYHGPIIDISDQARTPAAAIRSTQLVMQEAGYQLAALQSQQGTNPQYFIKSQTVVSPKTAKKVTSSTMRKLIAVFVLEALAILAVAAVAEAVATRRSRRLGAQDEGATDDDQQMAPVEVARPPDPVRSPAVGRPATVARLVDRPSGWRPTVGRRDIHNAPDEPGASPDPVRVGEYPGRWRQGPRRDTEPRMPVPESEAEDPVQDPDAPEPVHKGGGLRVTTRTSGNGLSKHAGRSG